MGRKKKILPLLENVEVTDIASEGKAVGRVNNLVVFIEGAVPGDVADVQVFKKKKSFMEARPVKYHRYSHKRAEPFCVHFGTCGGCKWQHLQYTSQTEYKQRQVKENLKRLGGVELPEVSLILASEKDRYYRNKLDFAFSNKRWLTEFEIGNHGELNRDALGFHVSGRFDKIVDIEHCHLQPSPSNEIRNAIRAYALKNYLSFFDIREQQGFLRNLIIRNTTINEVMVILIFFFEDAEKREDLLHFIAGKFPEITSLMYAINPKKNDSIYDLDIRLFKGRDHIIEEMEGLKFKVSPKSFYQTNPTQAYELYKIARAFAGLKGNETVYDLYTGTGTIANFVAAKAKKVIGIESVPEAIEDAKINSWLNGIKNTLFFAGDMKEVLNDSFIDAHGRPDVIITDPPRAGMHEDVVKKITSVAPVKVVYVSCNPATQARDIALMDERYKVVEVQPVDMFPHTYHVENVVLLERKE